MFKIIFGILLASGLTYYWLFVKPKRDLLQAKREELESVKLEKKVLDVRENIAQAVEGNIARETKVTKLEERNVRRRKK